MTLEQIIEDGAEHDGAYAIAYALLRVAYQLKHAYPLNTHRS